ncbi:aspartate--ammonia ligase [uncultured Finegoldia sp.]|uniref:aspartate--ammonia ligase n=1 Tax=uncultured Finegoldia sp. TaxID=328009 RepID=UPI00261B3D92|nr:aspartate--ammonia ligase [uncultured Finegoldia sp.]
MELQIPKGYKSSLDLLETQKAIKIIKDFFQYRLSDSLNLTRVSAPLFVRANTGINDNLNGVETPVGFEFLENGSMSRLEIVQSLAKWKRVALKKYNIEENHGIYTDMNAIRPSEICDNTHSLYVDQWDWEKVMSPKDRNIDYLKETVRKIYQCFLDTQTMLINSYEGYKKILPDEITFVTTEDLEDMYPEKSSDERENLITKKYGAVFLIGIGDELKSGKAHSDRSPDYDDWSLNGDILVYNPVLDNCLELSSMGIRVDKDRLVYQLNKKNNNDRINLEYHQLLLNDKLPQSIGGGIGQSRICMFFLQKAHIGEVQSSIWPEDMVEKCEKLGIKLL